MYIFFINFSVPNFLFVYNSTKELRKAIREDLETHDFVKRGVHIHHNEVQKVGFLGWPNEICENIVQL
jgi:UDP-N-acetyl-D-mannosaminuronic acid transferase (WecB/TagA/CpsF family)